MKLRLDQRALNLIALGLVGLIGCQSGESRPPDAREDPNCPGATVDLTRLEYHPRVLRGRVLAPNAELAWHWTDLLISSAHAAPMEDEQPVPQARVMLFRVDPSAAKQGPTLQQTTTDSRGAWCMGLPEGVEPGGDLMLAADTGELTVRRLVVSPITTDIYTGTEALVRILENHRVDLHQLPMQTYLNMESIADTAVDLLTEVELDDDDNVSSLIEKLQPTITADPRFSAKLEKLTTLPQAP